ncbi:MAG TPA: type II secretion system ATPase GspE [Candidatus Brocadiales bacterium]|nr:type II secretion system ATPase GspE [Candidatus Brocadiales bacterium]
MKQVETNSIGNILIELGKVSKNDIDRALEVQKQTGQTLWRLLIDLGLVSEEDLRRAWSQLLDVPVWEKKKGETYPIVDNLPYGFLVSNKVLPLRIYNNTLDVAVVDPQDTSLLEVLAAVTKKELNIFVGCEKDIINSVNEVYKGSVEEESVEDYGVGILEIAEDIEQLKDLASEAPVIRLVNSTLTKAIEISASDIHMEMYEKNTKLRYRVDGVLRDFPAPQKELYPAIISRIKIMSKLNIAEKRLPQDGRIKLKVAGREIDLRVSIIPMIYGEGVVLRILDRSSVSLDLETLGFDQEILKKLRWLIKKPEGMILVTGPTGSGKTTTLYSVLKEIRSPELKIVTIEDPVEYSLEGTNQIQINTQIDLTFANGLRSILRHDPDVILIGEIRDRDTASIAIQSALTGHLVFSTLHTNDSASAFTRLLDMAIEDYLISSCVIGVLAQRLVRKICPICKEAYLPDEEMRIKTGIPEGKKLYRAVGCDECNHTGYGGRLCISELLIVDDVIRKFILTHEDSNIILKEATKKGLKTLWQDGLTKVIEGKTTLDELMRVADIEDEGIIR